MTTFVCTIEIDEFWMHYWNWWIFNALLEIQIFLFAVANGKMCAILPFEIFSSTMKIADIMYVQLQLTIFICNSVIEDNFCMHNCNWKHNFNTTAIDNLSCIVKSLFFLMYYWNWQELYSPLELTIFLNAIAIHNLCIH